MKLTRSKLEPHVAQWVAESCITPAQGEAILARYPERGGNFWMAAFAAIGSVLVVSGIGLIIAGNWKDIPDLAKMAGLLLLLVASSMAAIEWQARGKGRAWWECASIGAAVFPLLGLALISQIFHLGGDSWKLFLTWTLSIVAIPLVSRSIASFVILLAAVLITVGTFSAEVLFRSQWWWATRFEDECFIIAATAALIALASQAWRWVGELALRNVGEYLGLTICFLAVYLSGFDSHHWFLVWAMLFAACLALICRGSVCGRVHQVNLGFAMTGLVILSIFLRLVGTMMETGLIFLVGGVGLIVMVILLNYVRRQLVAKVRRSA